ncbi:MAG: phosphotransferase [Gaiellaceae bacterium]
MSAPPPHVLKAFGVADAESLPGGRGTSWRVGGLVLKPLDMLEEELVWRAEVLGAQREDGFRIAVPLPQLVDGWCASRFVEGRHEPRRWTEIVAAGSRLHAALAGVPRPDFLDLRTDRWAIGDRVAWGEPPPPEAADAKHLRRLLAALRPVDSVPQLVHGDLTGNVLFEPGLPPAVIDFAPYWRPEGFGGAVVVADALTWEGADATLLDAIEIPELPQLLLRALVYRIVTDALFRLGEPLRADGEDPFLPAVELALGLV